MSKRLEAMRSNPRGDWRISDIESICREFGISCDPPRGGGSHYKISHRQIPRILTPPSKRPIKIHYIKELITFIDELKSLV